MEALDMKGVLKVVGFSLSQAKWKLNSSSKHELETDILALLTEMRPVIMIDYDGKMRPELQEHLSSFLNHCKKESSVFECLKVMVIAHMIYLVHTKSLAKFVNSHEQLLFIDLEQDPPKMVAQSDKCSAVSEFLSIQKRFSTLFRIDGILQSEGTATHSATESGISASSELIDLSSWYEETEIILATWNGWLLGYPVVYLFRKKYMREALYNVNAKSLRSFALFVTRNGTSKRVQPQKEELMGFTAPYLLSLEGEDEEWAKAFVGKMKSKLDGCKHVWSSLQMEVRRMQTR